MHELGVGFFVDAGIPKGPRSNTFEECGCCGSYHRSDFHGDCREDAERFAPDEIPEDAEVVDLEDDECEFEQRQPHEWYCVVRDVTKVAGTTEPIKCDHDDDEPFRIPCSKCSQPTTRDEVYGDLCWRCCRADNE
jgi:hypothetical protein